MVGQKRESFEVEFGFKDRLPVAWHLHHAVEQRAQCSACSPTLGGVEQGFHPVPLALERIGG